ncbi:hypothetical protein FTUN_0703 [Frigoriglobus tundricola]|uniref:Uncharacterized protein n=1 Tax=Frigoriglobus tundricola TaxID=2774151 RepID=A0A6M5YGT1_9BACT|nr:hypothetical protein FTUN_0703 [Frigoriglobus tundricola]
MICGPAGAVCFLFVWYRLSSRCVQAHWLENRYHTNPTAATGS